MNTKQIVTGVVALVVAIVITVACAIPVISDSTQAEDTFSNVNGSLFIVEKITEDKPYTMVWDVENPYVVTVNDVEIELTPSTILCTSDTFLLRHARNGANASIQTIGDNIGVLLSTSSATTGTVTVDNTTNPGYLTFTSIKDGGDPVVKTDAIGDTYGISSTGNYVMKSSTQKAYLASDSEILAMGLTTFDGNYATGFYVSGNPTDGFSVDNFYPDPATATVSNITSDLTQVSGYVDLYTLKEIKFLITGVEDTTVTLNATYNYFIVPAEVTVERAIHPDSTLSTIINVIPVLLIVSIIIGAVALFISNRRD